MFAKCVPETRFRSIMVPQKKWSNSNTQKPERTQTTHIWWVCANCVSSRVRILPFLITLINHLSCVVVRREFKWRVPRFGMGVCVCVTFRWLLRREFAVQDSQKVYTILCGKTAKSFKCDFIKFAAKMGRFGGQEIVGRKGLVFWFRTMDGIVFRLYRLNRVRRLRDEWMLAMMTSGKDDDDDDKRWIAFCYCEKIIWQRKCFGERSLRWEQWRRRRHRSLGAVG